jgi:uncharacterized protein
MKKVWKRRQFLAMGGAFAAIQSLPSFAGTNPGGTDAVVTSKSLGRMAFSPATRYRPYISKTSHIPDSTTWIQIDLGSPTYLDSIRLYPAFHLGQEDRLGFGFPVRFKLELSDVASFVSKVCIIDSTSADCPDPKDAITEYSVGRYRGRYIRLSALKLRPVPQGTGFNFALSKVEVLLNGVVLPIAGPVTGDDTLARNDDLTQLIRPQRPMGEGVITDNVENLIPLEKWATVPYRAAVPLTGVSIQDGLFRAALEKNIGYLLSSFSVEEMLRPFRQRAGKYVRPGLREPIPFWDTELLGSSAGRFLMGAGNTLRWIDHPELRSWMDELVDGIEDCRQPNGYIMAYPEDSIYLSERGGYTRAWLTHGLIEAGYAGNAKAFPLLRGYYDWFNQSPYLPKLLRLATQGVQGMIANTRMYFTPVGKSEDIQVVQRYFQENYWLQGLSQHESEIVWQYPYDRPHNYLITDFEAYLDIYRATGSQKYLHAMKGAWDLYHTNWEHVGGSIAITEFGEFPPQSYRLLAQQPFCETGETCGSVFWARFNQRFHLLDPEQEKYVSEIEKSIYNVVLANQIGQNGIIYHARLVGQKGDLHNPLCTNSCCEGQGTRMLGSIPEYIYSLTADGIYVNLFSPSRLRWKQQEKSMEIIQHTTFPFSPEVTLRVVPEDSLHAKIRIRVPTWASKEMPIFVNDRLVATGTPGSYVTLNRAWLPDDTIKFELPMDFKLTRYAGTDKIAGYERYALEYGPILMALAGSASAVLKVIDGVNQEDILKQLYADPDDALRFQIKGNPDLAYIPYWKILNEPFTCYPCVSV